MAVAVLVLYGGLLFGVLPTRGFVSWEGHLKLRLRPEYLAGVLAARFIGRPPDRRFFGSAVRRHGQGPASDGSVRRWRLRGSARARWDLR